MKNRTNRCRGRTLRTQVPVALLALALGAVGTVLAAPPARAATTCEARMLELVNQSRAGAGVAPLALSPTLAGIAEDAPYQGCGYPVAGRSADMGARNYFSHTILQCGQQTVGDMLTAAGIRSTAVAENIAW